MIDPRDPNASLDTLTAEMVALGWRFKIVARWDNSTAPGPYHTASFFRRRWIDDGWVQGNRSSLDVDLAVRVAAHRAHLAMKTYLEDEEALAALLIGGSF